MTMAIFGSANIDISVNVDELPDSGQTIHARGQQINIGEIWIFLAVLLFALLAMIMFPEIVLFLPRALGY